MANAIKFSGKGNKVRVSAARIPDGRLQISVADTGPGIAAEDMARILRPFERATDGMSQEIPGVGLGLPLASHLIALHGGELTMDSVPGQGTIASFCLPADRVLTPATSTA